MSSQVIIEEEQSDQTNKSVQDFLKGLDEIQYDAELKSALSSRDENPGLRKRLPQQISQKPSWHPFFIEQLRESTPIMAFNDLRRLNAKGLPDKNSTDAVHAIAA